MKYLLPLLALVLSSCTRVAPISAPETPAGGPEGRTRIGNGGDDDALRGNAWFLGAEKIRVCLETQEAPTPLEKASIEEAFEVWRRYFSEKRINEPEFYPERSGIPAHRSLQAGYQWVECSEAPELRIVVGKTSDARLNWERLNEFPGQSAFVMRREYDAVKGRGQGDMWISSSRLELKTEIAQRLWLTGHAVHELGHVFGCPHVPDTVMAEDFIKVIEAATKEKRTEIAKWRIGALWPDQKRELVTCLECPVQVTRGSTHTQWDVFAALFGSDAIHEVSPLYYLDVIKAGKGAPYALSFTSSAPDWKRSLPIEEQMLVETSRGDLPLFKISFNEGEARGLQSFAFYQTSARFSGIVKGKGDNGEVIPIPLRWTRNSEKGALILHLTDREEPWLKGTRVGALLPETANE